MSENNTVHWCLLKSNFKVVRNDSQDRTDSEIRVRKSSEPSIVMAHISFRALCWLGFNLKSNCKYKTPMSFDIVTCWPKDSEIIL